MAVDEFPVLLAERVKAYRLSAGLTQRALAEATGLPENTISRIERWDVKVPNLVSLIVIAHACNGATVSDLLGDGLPGFTLAAAGLDAEVPGA